LVRLELLRRGAENHNNGGQPGLIWLDASDSTA
jgi:hypothetical protein